MFGLTECSYCCGVEADSESICLCTEYPRFEVSFVLCFSGTVGTIQFSECEEVAADNLLGCADDFFCELV